MKVEVCQNTDRPCFRVYADETFEKPHAWMKVTDIGDPKKVHIDNFHFNPVCDNGELSTSFEQRVELSSDKSAYDWFFVNAEDIFRGWHLKKGQV